MPKYNFEAKATNGKDMKGEIEAGNEAEARVKLRAQRMIPLRIVPAGSRSTSSRSGVKVRGSIKPKELQIMTRQLSTLLGAGIPLMQAVETLATTSSSPVLKAALKGVQTEIERGKRLSDAFGEFPRIFGRFYVNMLRAGEESGNLDIILQRLAVYIEKSVKLQSKVKGALVYPAVILVVAFAVVAGLMIFVIPKFATLFSQFGGQLPALTLFVMQMSDAFVSYWYIIIGVFAGGGYALMMYLQTEVGKQNFDTFIIRAPIFGPLVQKGAVARMTGTLATLLSSGVSIVDALEIASRTVGNYVMERAILRARDAIVEGKSLTVPLSKEKFIPNMMVQMIGVGEQSGSLDQMLTRIADFYEDEVDVAVGTLTTIIEPLMMVVLGGIVAFIVIAMYLPIFNLAGQVSK